MWSHYATNHEGLCFQFELARDIETFSKALPVNYNDDYPVVNWIKDVSGNELFRTLLQKHGLEI